MRKVHPRGGEPEQVQLHDPPTHAGDDQHALLPQSNCALHTGAGPEQEPGVGPPPGTGTQVLGWATHGSGEPGLSVQHF